MLSSLRRPAWRFAAVLLLPATILSAAENRASATVVAEHPIATTTAGRVRGYHDHGITVFKGIPYGADTAKFRFRPPVPPEPWNDVLDTLEFRAASPQDANAKPNPDWGVV